MLGLNGELVIRTRINVAVELGTSLSGYLLAKFVVNIQFRRAIHRRLTSLKEE